MVMNAGQLRDLTQAELEAKATELRGELFGARLKKATGQLEDTSRLRKLRRDVARVETVLRERREAGR
jgi:large subunit ribosomal protein L29